MIAILGDLHLASTKDYFVETAEQFLSWFDHWERNNEENELILAGDLVQSFLNAGIVVDMLYRLFSYSRFAHMHIVVGNHDKKLKDGVYQLAYEFARANTRVSIYEREQITTIQGFRVLMLPHYVAGAREQSMADHYAELYRNPAYVGADLLVGHVAQQTSLMIISDSIANLEKLEAKKMCLGHIHTRIDPQIYIGSVYANRVTENAVDRAAWLLDQQQGFFEEPLPIFNEFLSVSYPDELPATKALVPIYTITNCANESIARSRYGGIYIRRVQKSLYRSSSFAEHVEMESEEAGTYQQLFEGFLRSQDPPVDRRVAAMGLKLLVGDVVTN
jgi:predicted phosphodiesterase